MSSSSSSSNRNRGTRFRHSDPKSRRKRDYDVSESSHEKKVGNDVVKAGRKSKMTSPVSASSATSNQSQGRPKASAGSLLVPEMIAKVAVPVYLFTITATWVLGVGEVAPTLYLTHPPSMLLFQRILMTFLYLQMMFNWLCIRYVDSSYFALLKARWMKKKREGTTQKMWWGGLCGNHSKYVVMWFTASLASLQGRFWEKEGEKSEGFITGEEERSGVVLTDVGEQFSSKEEEAVDASLSPSNDVELSGQNHTEDRTGNPSIFASSSRSQNENLSHSENLNSDTGSRSCSENETGNNTFSNSNRSLLEATNSEKGISLKSAEGITTQSSNETENNEGKTGRFTQSSNETANNKGLRNMIPQKEKGNDDTASSQEVVKDKQKSEFPWKPEFNPPDQKTFSYWSWAPCYHCQIVRPPRCHHCSECNTCVLKRDHHCYFAGNCVGFKNQRHFLVFGAWAFFSCCYATSHALPYNHTKMWPDMRWFDLFAPVAFIRWMLGYVPGMIPLNICVQTLLFYFILLSLNFVVEHVDLIARGLTSFELRGLKKNVEVKDCSDVGARFRAVMGRNWFWNLLCPVHWLFEAEEDPENWPFVSFLRH